MRTLHFDHNFSVECTLRLAVEENGDWRVLAVVTIGANGKPVLLKQDFVDVGAEKYLIEEAIENFLSK